MSQIVTREIRQMGKHAFIKRKKALLFPFEIAVGEYGTSLEIFKNMLCECARTDN